MQKTVEDALDTMFVLVEKFFEETSVDGPVQEVLEIEEEAVDTEQISIARKLKYRVVSTASLAQLDNSPSSQDPSPIVLEFLSQQQWDDKAKGQDIQHLVESPPVCSKDERNAFPLSNLPGQIDPHEFQLDLHV